jgi:transposase
MADAEAIGAAVTRPTMRFVPIKEDAQQDLQALHRIRDHLVKARTALIHERRGWLSESGIVLPKGIARFRQALLSTLTHEQDKLTALSRHVFRQLHEGRPTREPRLTYDHEQLEAIGQADPTCPRLLTIPGVGLWTARALVPPVSDATHVNNGRPLAAWLGLVPRQPLTGGQPRLLGISTHGQIYIRKLFLHGA